MTSTQETINILVFADKTTNRNCHMLGDQQAVDPSHVLSCEGTSDAHGVPPNVPVTTSDGGHHVSVADTCVLRPRSAIGCYRSSEKVTGVPQ
jgi:hypothetical protein